MIHSQRKFDKIKSSEIIEIRCPRKINGELVWGKYVMKKLATEQITLETIV
jgi:hypothetical protein